MDAQPVDRSWWRRAAAACAVEEALPAWWLLWVPLVLTPAAKASLTSALAGVGAILAVAALSWAEGRGSAGVAAERGFAGLWLTLWAAAGAALAWLAAPQGWPARLALFLAVVMGAALLGWAWRLRARRLTLAVPEESRTSWRRSEGRWLLLVWAATCAVLTLLTSQAFHPADLGVYGVAVLFYAALSIRGRGRRPREER